MRASDRSEIQNLYSLSPVFRTVQHRCEGWLFHASLHSGFNPEVSYQDVGYARHEELGQDCLLWVLAAARICRKSPFRSIISVVGLDGHDVAGRGAVPLGYCRYSFHYARM